MKRSSSYFFTAFIILIFSAGLIAFPDETAKSVRDALSVCAHSVIPSLFPFFVVSRLVCGLGYADFLARGLTKIMRPVFGLGGGAASALVLGLTGGYPIGASTCALLYSSRACTKTEAERLLAFCNNSGPAFIIGAIGTGVYSSPKIGFLLFGIHALAAFTSGFLFRLFSPIRNCNTDVITTKKSNKESFSSIFTGAISQAMQSCLSISAYIVLFSVVVAVLTKFHIFSLLAYIPSKLFYIDKTVISSFLSGILEVTSGVFSIADAASTKLAFVLTSFLLGFGGLSVHFQTLGILEGTGLDISEYFPGKLYHGIISAVYALIFYPLIGENAVSAMSYTCNSAHHISLSIILFILILIFIAEICKKGWKSETK